jgi:hypothetical protein
MGNTAWTPERDARLVELKHGGRAWKTIALYLCTSETECQRRWGSITNTEVQSSRRDMSRPSTGPGRPKVDGDRYPSGQLKPRKPNPKVMEMRRAIAGANEKADLTKTTDPIDLACARGWLTEAESRAAKTLERLYNQSGFGAPRMNPAGLHEVQPSLDIDMRPWSEMPNAEIAEIWDKVMCDEATVSREARAEASNLLWRKIMKEMPIPMRNELFSVCIAQSWPQWIVYLANGKDVPEGFADRRKRLHDGLAVVRSVMAKAKPSPPSQAQPLIQKQFDGPKGPRREEHFTYVDTSGAAFLEVVKITRRPA